MAKERDRLARLEADAEETRRNLAEGPAARLRRVRRLTTRTPVTASLAGIEAFLRRYIAFASEHEAVAIALWIAHAHLVEAFDVSPILTVTSAELRSGKTRVLDCLELLVPEPVRLVIPSEAVLYTILAQRPRPTLLLDEADAIFGPRMAEKYEGIRAVLNSGNRRGTPVRRVNLEGRKRRIELFDVYGAKAIAGIGKLPDTVADRAVPIRIRRRSPTEIVARFRQKVAAVEAQQLAFDWTSVAVAPKVAVPDDLNDRAADSWEPLIAIAHAVGGSWPIRARLAAIALSTGDDEQVSVGIRLLGDIREVFADDSHLPTAELLRRLHDLEEAPWGDWYGKPLTARALAKILAPYRVLPVYKRVSGLPSRGYFRVEFVDSWIRYLPPAVAVVADVAVPAAPSDEPATLFDSPQREMPTHTGVPIQACRLCEPLQALQVLHSTPSSRPLVPSGATSLSSQGRRHEAPVARPRPPNQDTYPSPLLSRPGWARCWLGRGEWIVVVWFASRST